MKTKDEKVLIQLKKVRKTTELLANPLYNDFLGSHFWDDIDRRLQVIVQDIEENLKEFNVIK